MIFPQLSGAVAFGGDYNPEQWPESVWLEDVELMKAAGVNLVTLGVFSWSRLQSGPGQFDFGWLDRVMDLLAKNAIGVDLATATASPPPWLSHRYPDVLAVDENGIRYAAGSRQHYSPCSRTYRAVASDLVYRLVERYARHPALWAWHINNEFMCHVRECHSEESTEHFQKYLKSKYKTIEALNDAWSTSFWSQHYQGWEEIQTPRRAPYLKNPAQQLDYHRFMDEAALSLYTMERKIIASGTPKIPVTTNFMGFFKPLNQQKWADRIDFASWDSYPDPNDRAGGAVAGAAGHDLTRSLKGKPFVLMEQATSAVNWRVTNAPKPAGLMRLWSLQAIARGADAVMFFQWRASLGGAEKYHSAMVPHVSPLPNRTFSEVTALGQELKKLAAVVGTGIKSHVAILLDWEAWWAVELDGKPARVDYSATLHRLYRHFYERNLAVDFVHPSAELDQYQLVLAPVLYLVSERSARNIAKYVTAGGTLIGTYFTGIVDECEQAIPGGYGGHLREVFGLSVESWSPLGPTESVPVRFEKSPRTFSASTWSEQIVLQGAKAVAEFSAGPLKSQPAATKNTFGRGTAYYLGTELSPPAQAHFFDRICSERKLTAPLPSLKGVEISVRGNQREDFIFILNHRRTAVKLISCRLNGRNLISGRELTGSLKLAAHDVAVVRVAHHRG